MLVDGFVSGDNDEIFADTNNIGTPLAWSIYKSNSDSVGIAGDGSNDLYATIYSYFKKWIRVLGPCQPNWLIVLTDGANNAGGDPGISVKSL